MNDYTFIVTESGQREFEWGTASCGRGYVTYPSHQGYTLHTSWYKNCKEGFAFLVNDKDNIVLECSFHVNVLSGPFTVRTPEGVISQHGCFVDGRREGLFRFYDSEGRVASLTRFDGNQPISVLAPLASQKGYWKEENSLTNTVRCVCRFTPDYASYDGVCYMFENGEVKRGELYDNGAMNHVAVELDGQFRTEYDKNGNKCFIGKYTNSMDCLYEKNDFGCVLEDGKVKEVDVYQNGEKKRLWKRMEKDKMTEFDENGVVVYQGGYTDDPLTFCPRSGQGVVYKNGVVSTVEEYKNGHGRIMKVFENGLMKEYGKDGRLSYWGEYKNDPASWFPPAGKGAVYDSGSIQYIGVLNDNDKVVTLQDFRDGVMREYDGSGNVVYEGDYEMNDNVACRSGTGTEYRPGCVVVAVYRDGEMVESLSKRKLGRDDTYDPARYDKGFSVLNLGLSVVSCFAIALLYYLKSAFTPYVMLVYFLCEAVFMVRQYFDMTTSFAFYTNATCSLLCSSVFFCLAFMRITSPRYSTMATLFFGGLVCDYGYFVSEREVKKERGIALHFAYNVIVFVLWLVLFFTAPQSLNLFLYSLLILWFCSSVFLIVYHAASESHAHDARVIVLVYVCLLIVTFLFGSMDNNYLGYATLVMVALVIYILVCTASVPKASGEYSCVYAWLFTIGLVLCIGWGVSVFLFPDYSFSTVLLVEWIVTLVASVGLFLFLEKDVKREVMLVVIAISIVCITAIALVKNMTVVSWVAYAIIALFTIIAGINLFGKYADDDEQGCVNASFILSLLSYLVWVAVLAAVKGRGMACYLPFILWVTFTILFIIITVCSDDDVNALFNLNTMHAYMVVSMCVHFAFNENILFFIVSAVFILYLIILSYVNKRRYASYFYHKSTRICTFVLYILAVAAFGFFLYQGLQTDDYALPAFVCCVVVYLGVYTMVANCKANTDDMFSKWSWGITVTSMVIIVGGTIVYVLVVTNIWIYVVVVICVCCCCVLIGEGAGDDKNK